MTQQGLAGSIGRHPWTLSIWTQEVGHAYQHDIVIVGLGAMGASAAYQLSKRNVRVIGLEQFKIGHVRGSSHGESRIVRQACYEHPSYAPLSLRSYQLLDELEKRTGRPHSVRCGGLMIGLPNSAPVAGKLGDGAPSQPGLRGVDRGRYAASVSRAQRRGQPRGFFEAKAGAVFPETMVDSWIRMAGAAGVEIREHHRVTDVEPHRGGVRVHGDGFVIDADQAIVAAGPWLDSLFPEMRAYLSVERIVQHWFAPRHPALFAPSAFPIFYWDVGPYQLYGFPSLDPGRKFVKVGLDNDRRPCRPDHVDRDIGMEELIRLDTALSTDIPDLQGPMCDPSRACGRCLRTATSSSAGIPSTSRSSLPAAAPVAASNSPRSSAKS